MNFSLSADNLEVTLSCELPREMYGPQGAEPDAQPFVCNFVRSFDSKAKGIFQAKASSYRVCLIADTP